VLRLWRWVAWPTGTFSASTADPTTLAAACTALNATLSTLTALNAAIAAIAAGTASIASMSCRHSRNAQFWQLSWDWMLHRSRVQVHETRGQTLCAVPSHG